MRRLRKIQGNYLTRHPGLQGLIIPCLLALLTAELALLIPVGLLGKLWYYGGCLALKMIALYYLFSSVWFWVHVNKT